MRRIIIVTKSEYKLTDQQKREDHETYGMGCQRNTTLSCFKVHAMVWELTVGGLV